MTSVKELYERSIKRLTAAERLRLATLILNGIAPQSIVDYSEEWSDQDYRDFNQAGWHQIDTAVGEEDDV